MAGLAGGWLGLAAGYLLKTTAVLALALLAAAAAHKRPAALRHFILSSALIGLLLLPVLSLAPAGWRAPFVPSWLAAPGAAGTSPSAAPASGAETGAPGSGALFSLEFVSSPASRPVGTTPTGVPGVADGETGAASHVPLLGAALRAAAGRLGLAIALAWAAGLAALLLRLAAGLSGASRLTAQGTPLEGAAWLALLERFLARLPLRRPVRLKSHPQVQVPLTWGWRRPVVLFPDGAESWSDDERSAALCHELSHVKRADFLVLLLVRAGLALFWWNPLCWIVYRRVLKEQEIACDELVLRAGIRPSAYAASLLAFRRSAGLRWSPSAALPGLLGRSPFQERLAAILRQKITFMEVKMKTKITVVLTLLAAVALVGTARPAAGQAAAASRTVLTETAAVLGTQAVTATAAQAAVAQEKPKEQGKAKEAEKAEKAEKKKEAAGKTIVVRSKGEKLPLEITITEGGQSKTLVLDRTVTLTKGEKGDILLLKPEGQDPIVLKGEPLRIEIKGGALEVVKEGRPVKVLKRADGRDGIVVVGGPDEPGMTWVAIEGKPAAEGRPVKVIKEKNEKGETVEGRAVAIAKDSEGGAAWTAQGKPSQTVWIEGGGQDMLAKIQALEEQVQAIKAKKMDLAALEESLKKLEAELKAKEEKLKTFQYRFAKEGAPEHGTIVFRNKIAGEGPEKDVEVEIREDESAEAAAEARAEAEAAAAGRKSGIKVRVKNDGPISFVFTGQAGAEGKKAFERAVTKLSQELPDGYQLAERSYDPETGAMTFRIDAPKDAKMDKALVEKLVEMVRSEIDKK